MDLGEIADHTRFHVEVANFTRIRHEWDDFRPHSDPYTRLYFVVSGRGWLEHDGSPLALRAGSFYLLPAGTTLLLKPSPGMEHFWVHFMAHLPGGVEVMRLVRCPVAMPLSAYPPFVGREAPSLCQRLVACHMSASSTDELEARAILNLLLAPYLRASSPLWTDYRWYQRFGPVLTYIEAHLDEEIAVPRLASIVSLNPNYFSNLFTARFGESPHRYITRRRIDRAQVLLWTTTMPLKEIAATVGYDDPCHFSRVFRRVTGITAGSYRGQRNRLQPAAGTVRNER